MFALLGPAIWAGYSAAEAPPPTDALRVHAAVQEWVREWSVPASDDPGAEGPAVWGAAVTIRLDGVVLARSDWYSAESSDPLAVWRAAGPAIRKARSELSASRDASTADALARAGARAQVSLELFGESVPIPRDELALPLSGCSPAAEALVVTLGDRAVVSGVDAQLSRSADPTKELGALASSLSEQGGAALRPLDELLADGLRFARAPVTHLASPFAGAAPVFLDRGSRVVGRVGTRELAEMADGFAGHLRSRVWPGVERYGLSGTLNPVTAASDPLVAEPFAQSLAALALIRHAGLDQEANGASRTAAERILLDLGVVEDGEQAPWADPVAASSVLGTLAAFEAIGPELSTELESLRARCRGKTVAAFSTDTGFDASVPIAARSVVAWGLASDRASDPAVASAAVRTVFRETPPAQLVAHTPFLVWAEMELHPSGAIPSSAALTEMRATTWSFQLHPDDLDAQDADLAGGILFTRSRSVLPTWQSLRPLTAFAAMLGDERLTPGAVSNPEVLGEIVRLTGGFRFVRQLAMTGDGLFFARVPRQSEWGVRRAPWDPALSPEATALALIATCDALASMRAVGAREVAEADQGSGQHSRSETD